MAYSTVILTFNEESNLPRCLESLAGCDDVVVLDSGSDDRTQQIGRAAGARVFERKFDDFAAQRNFALDTVPFKHDWILHLDADECMTPKLHAELLQVCREDSKSAYLIANKLMFMGRWIRHVTTYPAYQSRLVKLGQSRFKVAGHGTALERSDRGTGTLCEPYVHHNFSKGISDWLARHNKYSTAEAERIVAETSSLGEAWRQFRSGDTPEKKRQALKRCADFLPLRPLVRFLYLYVWKWGFLDGRAGFDYSVLMAFYDYLIGLKVRELRQRCGSTLVQTGGSGRS
jgi:glycosyltransferase involved in cell wall biosynthesis